MSCQKAFVADFTIPLLTSLFSTAKGPGYLLLSSEFIKKKLVLLVSKLRTVLSLTPNDPPLAEVLSASLREGHNMTQAAAEAEDVLKIHAARLLLHNTAVRRLCRHNNTFCNTILQSL